MSDDKSRVQALEGLRIFIAAAMVATVVGVLIDLVH